MTEAELIARRYVRAPQAREYLTAEIDRLVDEAVRGAVNLCIKSAEVYAPNSGTVEAIRGCFALSSSSRNPMEE